MNRPWVSSWLLVLAVGLSACVDETGLPPPAGELYYPIGLAAHPDGRYLYVTNAVFDRRYNAGTLVVYDTWQRRPLASPTVQIGLFAGPVLLRQGPDDRLYGFTVSREVGQILPFRLGDDPRVAGHVECFNPERQGYGACGRDAGWQTFGPRGSALATDPLSLTETPDGIAVSHAGRGVVSVWGFGPDGAVEFRCQRNLPAGATAIARHPVLGWHYVTDRFSNRIQLVEPRVGEGRAPEGATQASCELSNRGVITIDPNPDRGRSRGLAFSADGSLLFVAVNTDRSLRVYDTSIGPNGTPRNTLLGAVPVGVAPNVVRVAGLQAGECRAPLDPASATGCDRSGSAGEGLVYVTAFGDDRVVVVDPSTLSVRARIPVGQGPHDIAFMPDADGRLRGYISNFEAHSLSVLDLEPGSPTRFTRIATID